MKVEIYKKIEKIRRNGKEVVRISVTKRIGNKIFGFSKPIIIRKLPG